MGASEQYEFESIKRELQSIINELDSIAWGINRNFTGIGNERCAQSIYSIADDYRYVKRKLNRIDTSKMSE